MKITLEEMKTIAKTLPIGYYLGRKTPLEIEESGAAYCDVVHGNIHIGMNILRAAADNIEPADAAKWDREKLLRCLLYHEIGHLLLTSPYISDSNIKKHSKKCSEGESKAILNIFEDERIETILSSAFIGVDFKGFCRLVNKTNANATDSDINKIFDAVRLRNTTEIISNKIDDFIKITSRINSRTNYCQTNKDGRYLFPLYREKVGEIIDMILDEKNQEQKQNQEQDKNQNEEQNEEQNESEQNEGEQNEGEQNEEQKEEQNEEQNESEQNKSEQNEDEQNKDEEQSEEQQEEQDEDSNESRGFTFSELGLPEDYLKAVAASKFTEPSSNIMRVLNKFALRLAKKQGSQVSGCWSGLHGKINTRRDAMDKEKIFLRKSEEGERLMQSVNLTLWIDRSGSFCYSEDAINAMLTGVSRTVNISKDKLNVNVVHMAHEAYVKEKSEWSVNADGGNEIDETYLTAWTKTRRKDRRNIDIVVFDGVCCALANFLRVNYSEDTITKLYGQEVVDMTKINRDVVNKIWNSHDCWVVSDTDNKKFFDTVIPKAHRTYIKKNYAEHLESRVIEILDRIL